jgi:hypothetical protein
MKEFFIKVVNDHSPNVFDGSAVGVGVLALLEMLPHVSAVLSVIWLALRIYVYIRDDVLGKRKDGNQ